jgi:type I restriction enzyme S subunit
LRTGDIVFARSGATVGKSFLVVDPPKNAVFASYLIRVRLDEQRMLPKVAALYFQSAEYWSQIRAGATGTGQPNFNGSKLAELLVPVGSIKDQVAIEGFVRDRLTYVERLAAEATSARKLIDRLDRAVLAKAFRGELVPQNPNDVPASVLLEQVKAERTPNALRVVKPKKKRA